MYPGYYQPLAPNQRPNNMVVLLGFVQILAVVVIVYFLWQGDLAISEYYESGYYTTHAWAYWSSYDSTLWLTGSVFLLALSGVLYSAFRALLISRFPESSLRQHKMTLGFSVIALILALGTGSAAVKFATSIYDDDWWLTSDAYVIFFAVVLLIVLSLILIMITRRSVAVNSPFPQYGYGYTPVQSRQRIPQSMILALGFFMMALGFAIANRGEGHVPVYGAGDRIVFYDHIDYSGSGAGAVLAILGILAVIVGTRATIRATRQMTSWQAPVSQPYPTYIPPQIPQGPPMNPGAGTQFCTNCGSALYPGSGFCTNCGLRVTYP